MLETKQQPGAVNLEFYPGGAALISRDGQERLLAVNEKLCGYYECSTKEDFLSFTGGTYRGMLEPDEYIPLEELFQRHDENRDDGFWFYHFLMQTKNGHFCRLEGLMAPYEDPQLGPVWTLNLIRSRFREDTIETDRVTGLFGRYAFYKRVSEVANEDLEKGTYGRFVPLYLNLTNFKMFNSNRGLSAGDALLRRLAACLRKEFPNAIIGHLSADNFALLVRREGLEDRLLEVENAFRQINDDPSVALKAGFLSPESLSWKKNDHFRQSFDKAKIAADSIKQDASRTYAEYTDEMGQHLSDAAYVLRHFDEALEKGYIQVYYQPVVRTLTGKLCSIEALARWVDPEKGVLKPSRFIPVLEGSRLITRLDFAVLDQVARLLRFQMENQRPLLPISVNLSRVDFDQVDPVLEVEALIQKYRLPRNLLHIEITETALSRDGEKLRRAIQRFRRAGYECWLDDFGSGYSSLNVLQRFRFDTIKLDMAFQRPFNNESRKILRSLVLMAKNLGIHTLAEGVETQEQLDFLRSIGCEKIQGYYYGKPLPYEECHQYCYDQNLVSESVQEASIMEKVGLTNVLTSTPLSVFWYDGGSKVRNLWENPAYHAAVESIANVKKYTVGQTIDLQKIPFLREFQGLLKKALRSGREETMIYVDNGNYVQGRVQLLAGCNGSYTGRTELYNLTPDDTFQTTRRLDAIARHLLQIYDGLYLYHGSRDEIEILGDLHASSRKGERVSRREWMTRELEIHPDDRQRFLDWAAPRVLYRQAQESGRNLAVGMFRIRKADGDYTWREIDALSVGQEKKGNLFFCIKNVPMEWVKDRSAFLPAFLHTYGLTGTPLPPDQNEAGNILAALKKSREIKFFWKDSERRFQGASRGFLEYYGLPDESSILGKTDEDLGWNPNENATRELEEKLLHEGSTSQDEVGKCIVRGQIHTIRVSKTSIYDGNRIIGFAGHIHDVDEDRRGSEKDSRLRFTDKETGLTDFRGMMLTGQEFYNLYEQQKEDFVGILFHIPELEQLGRIYGKEFRLALLRRISQTLKSFHHYQKSLGHLGDGRFLLLMNARKEGDLKKDLLRLSDQIHNIQEVHGHSVTLYLQKAVAYGSETASLEGFLRLLSERLDEIEKQQYGQSVYVGDRVAIERSAFDSTEQNVMLSDLDTYELLYINKAGLRDLGLPQDFDYRGKTCHKVLCNLDYPCDDCPRGLLRRDRFYTRTYHNRVLGRDYLLNHILVPWRGHNCHLEVAINLCHYMEDEIRENEYVFREMSVNDAIELGLQSSDPSDGILRLLAKVGELLECEKVCIFEERPDGTLDNTYEWCREGIPSTQARLQQLPRDDAQFIYDRFDSNQIAIIDNVKRLLPRYGRSRTHMEGLESLISGHLVQGGRSLGFTEVVNPSEKVRKEASPLLATLTRFMAIMLRNRNMVQRLNTMSYVDAMTDTRNRRAFQEYVQKLPPHKETAFIFGDMNGLKAINDQYGHKAGDKAIRTAADIMKATAGADNVFRVGGDEFLMIISDVDQKKTEVLIEQLKAQFQKSGISMAFGASLHRTPIEDVEALVGEADRRMYSDKKNPRA